MTYCILIVYHGIVVKLLKWQLNILLNFCLISYPVHISMNTD